MESEYLLEDEFDDMGINEDAEETTTSFNDLPVDILRDLLIDTGFSNSRLTRKMYEVSKHQDTITRRDRKYLQEVSEIEYEHYEGKSCTIDKMKQLCSFLVQEGKPRIAFMLMVRQNYTDSLLCELVALILNKSIQQDKYALTEFLMTNTKITVCKEENVYVEINLRRMVCKISKEYKRPILSGDYSDMLRNCITETNAMELDSRFKRCRYNVILYLYDILPTKGYDFDKNLYLLLNSSTPPYLVMKSRNRIFLKQTILFLLDTTDTGQKSRKLSLLSGFLAMDLLTVFVEQKVKFSRLSEIVMSEYRDFSEYANRNKQEVSSDFMKPLFSLLCKHDPLSIQSIIFDRHFKKENLIHLAEAKRYVRYDPGVRDFLNFIVKSYEYCVSRSVKPWLVVGSLTYYNTIPDDVDYKKYFDEVKEEVLKIRAIYRS